MTDQTKTKRGLLLAVLMFSTTLLVASAYADDTGYLFPTAEQIGTTGNAPSQLGQAFVDDVATGATDVTHCELFKTDNAGGGVGADSEIYYNFGFSIPSGATIDGIEVVVSGYRTGPSSVAGAYFSVRLNGGGGWTDYKNTPSLSLVDALYTLGTSDPLWGGNWTADSFSNANFRLEILAGGPSNTGEHWKLDSVSVKVYYTVATGFEIGDYFTYTQGGWGGPGNPGQILSGNFATVYPSGVEVGIPGASGYSMIFESATNVNAYLPAGGTPGALTEDLLNPTSDDSDDSSGVFGGQVLALQLNVDFSAADITQGPGGPVGDLVLCDTGTSLDGSTIAEILEAANTALGGGALPEGYTIDDLNQLVDNLNKAFDNGVPSSWAQDHLCS